MVIHSCTAAPPPVLRAVQLTIELFCTALLMAMTSLMASKLGGTPSLRLLLILMGVMLSFRLETAAMTVAFVKDVQCNPCARVAGSSGMGAAKPGQTSSQTPGRKQEGPQIDPYAPSVPPKEKLLAQYRNGRPVMVLPSVREMRLHGARRMENGAC